MIEPEFYIHKGRIYRTVDDVDVTGSVKEIYTRVQVVDAILAERERILNLPQIAGNRFAEHAIKNPK